MQRKVKNQIVNAILEDDAEQVRRLIVENKVDVNVTLTAQKVTLLMVAAKASATKVVRTLLSLGADVSMSDYIGRTASDYASKYGSDLVMMLLIIEEVKRNVHMEQLADATIGEANC